MNKQTAVEWLFSVLNDLRMDQEYVNILLDKAKEKEKEQMIDFATEYLEDHCFASVTGLAVADITAEEFYDKKFKK